MSTSYRLDPRSPKVVFHQDCGLSSSERLLYLALAHVADADTGLVEISLSHLAGPTGLDSRTLIKARRGLVARGAMEVVEERRGGPRPNVYRLTAGHLPTLTVNSWDEHLMLGGVR